ncbi:MAG: cytochrome c3 family protein [Anaeromyxobacteraceae bacterium]
MKTRILALALACGFAAGPALAAAPNPKFKLKPGADGKLCIDCHGGQLQKTLEKPFVHTPVKARACTGCHNPHAADHGKLLARTGDGACVSCHANVVPAKPVSTHPVIKEKGCVSCHDPHASSVKNVLLKPETELCAGCHKPVVEAAAKAKFKHRPVTEGCGACHDPHGSAAARGILKAAEPALCLGCHKTTSPLFSKAHQGYKVEKSTCTSCHDPHGSNVRGILYDTVHAPVAKAMCTQCHPAPTAPDALSTKKVGLDLCKGCHASQVTKMLDQGRVHRPVVEGQACLSCHSPHASRGKALVKANQVQVCGSCHADTVKRQTLSPTKHAPVKDGDCSACHEPHAGNTALLLKKADVPELCGTCHDWLKHSSHPMGPKVQDPRNKNLQVNCLSCHRSHGTEYKHMMPYATTSELCTKCHERYRR